MVSKKEKAFVDEWLKEQIKGGLNTLKLVAENNFGDKTCHYYSGHLYKDILENFPGRLSKKIFNKYKEYTNNTNLVFYQLKYDEHGYDYYVRKVKNETQKTA